MSRRADCPALAPLLCEQAEAVPLVLSSSPFRLVPVEQSLGARQATTREAAKGGGWMRAYRHDSERGEAPASARRLPAASDTTSSQQLRELAGHDVDAPPLLTRPAVTRIQSTAGNRAALTAVRRAAENRATPVAVQRTRGPDTATPRTAPETDESGQQEPGAAVIARLSRSIEGHVVLEKMKKNVWRPGSWWPEDWMPQGPMRLRRTLERRVVRGELLRDADLADIRTLATVNPQWLKEVGLGTVEEAEAYAAKGDYKQWLQLAPGRRLLSATLAYRQSAPGARTQGEDAPISPDYTLGRFMFTQAASEPDDGESPKAPLYTERDEQIRHTAVDTLHPAGLSPDRVHSGEQQQKQVAEHARRDEKAREVLTAILLVLQHGLKTYVPQQKAHLDYTEGDVIRALAHGGRVNIRVPALRDGESAWSATEFLGATDANGQRAEFVDEREFATHRTSIGRNTPKGRGTFEEKGGIGASLTNMLSPSSPDVGPARPQMMGVNISGGGIGSRDWNGDVVLPNGSYGHMLLVFTPPTTKSDGSLLVGIETIAPHAYSPVGYEHNFRSTEATANPESVLHGHKRDKIGSGGLKHNERLVDLQELGRAEGSGDWRAFLERVKRDWYAELRETEDGSAQRRALYEQLAGRRQHLYGNA